MIWAASSEFVSSSIPSWQILTAHAQPFIGARDLAFCLKVPLHSLLVWASSGGSGETARMRRLAWTFAARIGDKYQIRLTRSIYCKISSVKHTVVAALSKCRCCYYQVFCRTRRGSTGVFFYIHSGPVLPIYFCYYLRSCYLVFVFISTQFQNFYCHVFKLWKFYN